MSNYVEENLSTKQPPQSEETRISGANGNQGRTRRFSPPAGEGTQTPNAAPLLNTDFRLPKTEKLLKPKEFQAVYKIGKRYEGKFLTAFVMKSTKPTHRLGITASRKGIGNAVCRNRAKRLLREAFRLSKIELNDLAQTYDFVLNARRYLLKVKLNAPLVEFREIIRRVKADEISAD